MAKLELDDEEVFRQIVADELNVALRRVDVTITHLGGFAQVTIKIDGEEPIGIHREKLRRYAERSGGKEIPSA